jgi:hypothetical protein
MTSRRFPPPWRADKIAGGYVVRDANGQALAYVGGMASQDVDEGRGAPDRGQLPAAAGAISKAEQHH